MPVSKKKLKIAVLMGGPSSEHEVSLASGKMAAQNLDRKKYEVVPVVLPRQDGFVLEAFLPEDIDAAFLALHGEWGEDGQVQEILERLKVPYTGSDSRTSRLAINKWLTAYELRHHGLPTPHQILVHKGQRSPSVEYKCVVKPNQRGSSVGVSIVDNPSALVQALDHAFEFDDEVLIEKFIDGAEVTCGVLDDGRGNYEVLIPTRIVPQKGDFFNYASKYEKGGAEEITPPGFFKDMIGQIQGVALQAYKAVGCSGAARIDMFYGNNGKIYILEINTLPGMTQTSLLPQGAAALGIDFPALLDRIIESAFNRSRPE